MSRPAKWTVVVLAMMLLQVFAALNQTSTFDDEKPISRTEALDYFEHTHPLQSAISIESSLGDGSKIEVVVSATMEAQISLEII